MKKMSLLAMAIPLLFSCTPEVAGNIDEPQNSSHQKSAAFSVANPENPYDDSGRLRNILLDELRLHPSKSDNDADLLARVYHVAEGNYEIQAYKTDAFHTLSEDELHELRTAASLRDALDGLQLSADASSSFGLFVEGLLTKSEESYEELHSYILNYENEIISSEAFTPAERKVILTVTSLERYANHYRKKPKDKIWDLLIGNVMAGAKGAEYDTATAIINSVAAEAAFQQL